MPLFVAVASAQTDMHAIESFPVAVRIVGDDGLSQKFRTTLVSQLLGDGKLRLANDGDHPVLSIESDSNVEWDRLGGRTVVIYTVHLAIAGDRGPRIVGICYEKAMAKCAKDILRRARATIDIRSATEKHTSG